MTTIQDTTQLDLREIDSTGALKSGEKILADLRKRKLIVQRLLYHHLLSSINNESLYLGAGKDNGSP